jgi:5'-deoxynucleotidase YfbR-like HD superfamily hydrolase
MAKSKSLPEQRVFDFIAETGSLMFMKRTHQRSLINTFDTVASHSHHVGIIAYSLCRMEKLSHEDGLKALAMGSLHDAQEARTGDFDLAAKHYGKTDEEKAFNDLISGLPFGSELKELFSEYEERETLLSKCVKDADAIEQLYEIWILTNLGNQLASRWFKDFYKDIVPYLRTKSAKKIAMLFKGAHPHDWWYEDLVQSGKRNTYLNGKK